MIRRTSSRYWVLALVTVALLLLGAVTVAIFGERGERQQMAREASAQADLLASAVTGALAFDDEAMVQGYVNDVQINASVLAAGVYDERGRFVAGFARAGQNLPNAEQADEAATILRNGQIHVVRPVSQAGQRLGSVQLRLAQRPMSQRVARYAGFGLIILLAATIVLVLGFAERALSRRAAELARTNAELEEQIRERERVEEAMRQAQKMEAIGRLTGGVAHDFNNLLMAISSGVDLLQRTDDAERRKLLRERVQQAVERGSALTTKLLAFARTTPLHASVIDLAEHIDGLRVLLERSLRENIEIRYELAPDLWPVEVDVGELELAVLNLAVNARDAMPAGGVLTLRAENRRAAENHSFGDHVELSISDTGEGMPEAILERVFEPFFTTKEVGKGTGLGLSQVYGFARSSGGEASVRSKLGEGTAVTLCLPRSEKPLSPRAEERLSEAQPGRSGRILLVEDDDAVAEGVGQMLQDLGFSYVRTDRAEAALEALDRDSDYELILTDMIMPGEMDGLELARRVRSRHHAPVLLTTGYSESANRASAEDFPLLLKPYRLETLAEAIDQARAP